jgi:hypothetical protein
MKVSANTAASTQETPETIESIASQMLDLLTKMEALLPDLQAHDRREIARVAAAARFAHDLIRPTITTVTSVEVAPTDIYDVARGQGALLYRDQMQPISQRMAALNKALDFTIDSKLSAAGEDALQTYHWAKRAVKGPGGAALQPYLDEMKRVVKRAINHKPKKATPEQPPVPQGQTIMAPRPAVEDDGDELPDSWYRAAEDES